MYKHILPIILTLASFSTVSAQITLPTACGGGAAPAVACEQACISCNFNGFTGSTIGFPSGTAPDFCGTLENGQWIGFIAGGIQATFTVNPANCLNGDGVQIALYSDCTAAPLACNKGQADGGALPVSVSSALTPGANYFLLVDGYAGDFCDFTIAVTPNDAVYEPPLGQVGNISGPIQGCPGATFAYSVEAVFGASAYIWNGPAGTLVDSMPVPVTSGRTVQITLGNTSGPICVQAANTCKQNAACTGSLDITILPDSYRPLITLDSVRPLSCTGAPVALKAEAFPPAAYIFAWTSDSTGHIVSGANALIANIDSLGLYKLLVTNTVTGCTSLDSVRATVPDVPKTADLNIRHISCYGDANGIIQIGKVQGGTPPFLYTLDGQPFSSRLEYKNTAPGMHTISILTSDDCQLDTTFAMLEPAELLLVLPPDTTLHLGVPIQLWNNDMVNYPDRVRQKIASSPDLDSLLCDTCVFTPLNSFRYAITVLDSNGCRASDERTIIVTKERYVYFPNAFQPDAPDGNNYFQVYGGEDVLEFKSLRVYNRWGKLVFETSNFLPDDPIAFWDGRSEGKKLPPDVFVYRAEVMFKDGEMKEYIGDVTLVR